MPDHKCPDCGAEMRTVKLFGRGWENAIGLAVDTELAFYTGAEAGRSGLSGMFKAEGQVESWLCSGCGRIFLYAIKD